MCVYPLRFTLAVASRLDSGPNPGSVLRGAIYGALGRQYCTARGSGVPHWPDEAAACPVCWLLALEDASDPRGRDRPRPVTIEPPEPGVRDAGSKLAFGLTFTGRSIELLPFVVDAVKLAGENGIGPGRGAAALEAVEQLDALTGHTTKLLLNDRLHTPDDPVTRETVDELAARLNGDSIGLRFLTPTRITDRGALVRTPEPAPILARILERCEALAYRYGEPDGDPLALRAAWRDLRYELVDRAGRLEILRGQTRWVDTWSGSRRTGKVTPTGGFVGQIVLKGELAELLPWLLWGSFLHAGKNSVKGDGWYMVVRESE
jgi:hypothetical protein